MIATPFVARASPPQNDAGTGKDAPNDLDTYPLPYLGNGTYTGTLDPANNDTGDAYFATTPYCMPGNVTVHVEGSGVQVRLSFNRGPTIATPADFRFDDGCGSYRVEPAASAPSGVLSYSMVITAPLPPPLPDFKLVSVNVTSSQTAMALYPTQHLVRVTVVNIGGAGGGFTLGTTARAGVHGSAFYEAIGYMPAHLDAGASSTFTFVWNSTGDVGTFEVVAFAFDPCCGSGRLPWDSNESNNAQTTQVTIGAPLPGDSGVAGAVVVNFAKLVACWESRQQVCP